MSPRSGEDAGSRDSQPKPDNLFVRFRQFTDEQVSSLLQGIVGLPSAMSKNTPGNPRWADFDEDLRRRDELQARQKELRDSETQRATLPGQFAATNGRPPTSTYEAAIQALPLYARFAPGQTPGLDGLPDSSRVRYGVGSSSSLASLFSFDFYLNSSSSLHRYLGMPEFKTQIPSLFPYLFHSPYSPLILSTAGEVSGPSNDHFPYCHAFEDLLLASENRPMVPAVNRMYLYKPFKTKQDVMPWFDALLSSGLLTRPTIHNPSFTPADNERISRRTRSQQADAAFTEQDMYSRFLQRATSSSGSEIPPNPFGLLFSIADEIEKGVKAQFPELEKAIQSVIEEASSQVNGERSRESIVEDIKAGRLEGGSKLISIIEELASNKTERARALRSFSDELFGVTAATESEKAKSEVGKGEEIPYRSPSERDVAWNNKEDTPPSERVVSSSTTSEHVTNEDGSVERSVTVWMRFADGRETVTTKSHTEEPKRGEDAKETSIALVKEIEQKPKQSGWFWN